MFTRFEELNLHVYNSVRGLAYDCVIWCLGPLADESRDFGVFRQYLAFATAKACRGWMRLRD